MSIAVKESMKLGLLSLSNYLVSISWDNLQILHLAISFSSELKQSSLDNLEYLGRSKAGQQIDRICDDFIYSVS